MSPVARRLMLYPLIILAVAYAFLIFLAFRSDGMIFLPQPSSYHDSDIAAPYQLIKLHSGTGSDAHTITAIYLPRPLPTGGAHDRLRTSKAPEEPVYTLLMSHGNAEDIGENRPLYYEYARRGYAVFAYDYRGYGTSTGTPTESGAYADEHAAWDYMVNTLHIPPSRIIIHGTSVGCGPATELAAQLSSLPVDQRPAALVLRSPFRSAFTVLTHVPILPWDKFNNARRIRQVHMPVLVIHGMADEVIPFTHGQTVFHNAAPIGDADAPLTRTGGKQHLWIPNVGHNDVFILATENYFTKFQSFTNQLP